MSARYRKGSRNPDHLPGRRRGGPGQECRRRGAAPTPAPRACSRAPASPAHASTTRPSIAAGPDPPRLPRPPRLVRLLQREVQVDLIGGRQARRRSSPSGPLGAPTAPGPASRDPRPAWATWSAPPHSAVRGRRIAEELVYAPGRQRDRRLLTAQPERLGRGPPATLRVAPAASSQARSIQAAGRPSASTTASSAGPAIADSSCGSRPVRARAGPGRSTDRARPRRRRVGRPRPSRRHRARSSRRPAPARTARRQPPAHGEGDRDAPRPARAPRPLAPAADDPAGARPAARLASSQAIGKREHEQAPPACSRTGQTAGGSRSRPRRGSRRSPSGSRRFRPRGASPRPGGRPGPGRRRRGEPDQPGLGRRLQEHVVRVGDVVVELAHGRVQDPLRRPHPGPDAGDRRSMNIRSAALQYETRPPSLLMTSRSATMGPNDHAAPMTPIPMAAATTRPGVVARIAASREREPPRAAASTAATNAMTANATQAPRVPDTITTATVNAQSTTTTTLRPESPSRDAPWPRWTRAPTSPPPAQDSRT